MTAAAVAKKCVAGTRTSRRQSRCTQKNDLERGSAVCLTATGVLAPAKSAKRFSNASPTGPRVSRR